MGFCFGGQKNSASRCPIVFSAKVTGLMPGEVIWNPNDVHIYANQYEGVKEQLTRVPTRFPKIYVAEPADMDITKFKWEDVDLMNYNAQTRIAFAMNV